MGKWYEKKEDNEDILVASRIRLSRNFKDYAFPCRQSKEEQDLLLKKLFEYTSDLEEEQNLILQQCDLEEFGETHKKALRERYLIPDAAMKKKTSIGVAVSQDESCSILFECDDHIRMQISKRGLKLDEIWNEIDKLDDFFSMKEQYAFDNKLGYLTTFPTNLGTGMRAYVVLHLPILCDSETLRTRLMEMSRYGVNVRFGFGNRENNPGNLVVLYNQKTLGVSESESIQILKKVALLLKRQEEKIRAYQVEHYRLEMEDCICKSYGCLKYARILSLEDALEHISNLQWGISCGLVSSDRIFNGYELMLEIQDANLQVKKDCPMNDLAICRTRAIYIQERLPKIELK